MNIKEFIDTLNKKQIYGEQYHFYMVVDDEKYEIDVVWSIFTNTVDGITLTSCEDINDCFSLNDILNAKYYIEEEETNE